MSVYRQKCAVRLGLVHLLVTNLAMWLCTAVSQMHSDYYYDQYSVNQEHTLTSATRTYAADLLVTDHISHGGNAIASVRPSVCMSVRLFPLCLRSRLTVDLELLHVSIGHDRSS